MGMGATERLRFILTADVDGALKGFERVGNTAERELKKAEGGSKNLGLQMKKIGAGAVVFAGVAGAALLEVGNKWEEAANQAGNMATATGLTTQEASRWAVVARNADVDTTALATSMGKMNKAAELSPDKFAASGAEIVKTNTGLTRHK